MSEGPSRRRFSVVEHFPRGLVAALNSLRAEAFETRVFDETEWNWQEQLAIIRRPPQYIDMYPVGLAVLGCPMAPVHGQIPPQ